MTALSLENVKKSYAGHQVLHGIDLKIDAGEFVVFVGPSGCGKSTLLRMIAGLEEISSGVLRFDDRVMNNLTPNERGIAMVFQSYALYPHMTVRANMAFGLKLAKVAGAEIEKRVNAAAEMLQLTPYLERLPRQLSGGQRQRVAIGRAIVRDPKVFLFDEPLSNLDASLRVATRIEIAKLHERMPQTTMIYVTHDQVEAMTLADRIVVLNAGRVEQAGTPMELYTSPANLFVARFIGSPAMNILPCAIDGSGVVTLAGGGEVTDVRYQASGAGHLGMRPEDMMFTESDPLVSGTIDLVEQLGEVQLVYITTATGEAIIAKAGRDARLEKGSQVGLTVASKHLHVFDGAGKAVARAPDRVAA
ncbi:maltose/maltodextrin import ATP-binding protein MalK [Labrys miyagiensis]